MNRGFTEKLAWTNIKKNRKFYLPYILAATGMIMMFYLMMFLATNPGLQKMQGAQSLTMLMGMGAVLVAVFSVIFLFYINSFLMKQRSREIGLYNILGMEKRHIGKILLVENMITSAISILVGIGIGVLFSRLIFMLLCRIMGATQITYQITGTGVVVTLVLFAAIFFLILLRNQMRIHLSNPIELLHGTNAGEQEPKSRWFLAVAGVGCMIVGYVLSISIQQPLQALTRFFVAVLLVVAGTYLLFTVGSIALLKLLRANKKYYYRQPHFTAVSGMLYRMKQNAVGMANICILSTMVLVAIMTTVGLYTGTAKIVDKMAPQDAVMKARYERAPECFGIEWLNQEQEQLDQAAEDNGVTISAVHNYSYLDLNLKKSGQQYQITEDSFSTNYEMLVVTADEYERLTGKKAELRDDQVLLTNKATPETFSIEGESYQVKGYVDAFLPVLGNGFSDYCMMVVSDAQQADRLMDAQEKTGEEVTLYNVALFNADKPAGELYDMMRQVRKQLQAGTPAANYAYTDYRTEVAADYKSFTGGFLFLGIFLGVIFTFAAALIIYYKQISEGYYDRDKFAIMSKVGMSDEDVRKTIRGQVLMVFYIPLLVAGCHMLGAFNMISKMLMLFGMNYQGLLILCTVITFLCFAGIYAIVYLLTAKEYYRLVRR